MLPESAQAELREAANTPTDKDPHARSKAIDRAIDRLRLIYPAEFQEDDHEQDEDDPGQQPKPTRG